MDGLFVPVVKEVRDFAGPVHRLDLDLDRLTDQRRSRDPWSGRSSRA